MPFLVGVPAPIMQVFYSILIYDSTFFELEKGDSISHINSVPVSMIPNGLLGIIKNSRRNVYTVKNDKLIKEITTSGFGLINQKNFDIKPLSDSTYLFKIYNLGKHFTEQFLDSIATYGGKIKGLSLDFSKCPGGYLTEAINFVDCFLSSRLEIVTIVPTPRDYANSIYYSKSDLKCDLPITTVTISNQTASGAEIIIHNIKYYNLCNNIVVKNTGGSVMIKKFNTYLSDENIGYKTTVGLIKLSGKYLHNNSISATQETPSTFFSW